MESKLIQEFLAEQHKMMASKGHAAPAAKHIVRPERMIDAPGDDLESLYNHILQKKPKPKKVIQFLQKAIDEIMKEEE